MARKTQHDADYFPFYAKDGRTLFILQTKFGLEGIGFFTQLLRTLCTTPYHYIDLSDPVDHMYTMSKIGATDEKKADAMLDVMAQTDKIDRELWTKKKVIFSQAFVDSLETLYLKRSDKPISITELYVKYGISAPETPISAPEMPSSGDNRTGNTTETGQSAPEIPQSKVKDSKEKYSGNSAPEIETPETTTTFTASKLQEEIKASTGYHIDDKLAARFISAAIPEEWISGPESYFVFVKTIVHEKYPEKPSTELRTLFNTAVTTWTNLRDEYPAWLKTAQAKKTKAVISSARNQIPERCECGSTSLVWKAKDIYVCTDCHGTLEFHAETMRYVYEKHEDIPNAQELNAAIRARKKEDQPRIPDF